MTPTVFSRTLLPLALVVALNAPPTAAADEPKPNQLTSKQIADGWISLFDGETLFGWTPKSDANWKVEEGAITANQGAAGFLMTTSEFADYELYVEFKASPSTNSGVFLRTPLKPTDPAHDCYELNIAPDDNPFPTASLVARYKREMSWTSYPPTIADNENGESVMKGIQEGWLPLRVRMEGANVTVRYLEATRHKYTYIDPTGPRRGRIGLQFREGPVAFRNIRLRPLGLKPMLNGRDLGGWNDDQRKASKFELVASQDSSDALSSKERKPKDTVSENAELRVTGGGGQLESDGTYGDFTLQFDCRVDGDGLNSGVFFRCIPREYMNGYECQVANAVRDGDPTKPADFGTGAIYRRIAARRVNARDHEWFTTTIVATGPHIAVWVNGLQVTDWTDTRAPHDNPRNGLRTAAGTISLQGHDPTTDIRFRNMRIGELPSAQSKKE